MNAKNQHDENEIMKEATGVVLNLAHSQYSVQWTKIGNLQTSASSMLSFISIVATVVLGILPIQDNAEYLQGINSCTKSAFYIAISMSIIYMILSCFFMYMILRTKYVQGGLPYPSEMQDQIQSTINEVKGTYIDTQQILHANVFIVEKINTEIKNTDCVLKKNRFWYTKCLRSSFFSLAGSVLSLLFIKAKVFNNNEFYFAVLTIFSYLILLSFVFVIFFPLKKKCEQNFEKHNTEER